MSHPNRLTTTRGRGRGAALLDLLRSQTEEPASTDTPTTSMAALESGIQGASLQEREPAAPEPISKRGSGGKPIDLATNFVHLTVAKDCGVFEYYVSFSPTVDESRVRFHCLGQHRDVIGPVKVYFGSKLLLPRQLPSPTTIFTCKLPEGDQTVLMTLTFKWKKPAGDLDCLSVYNTIFRRVFKALNLSYMPRGLERSFFDPNNKVVLQKHHLEVWPGYVVTVDDFEGGLLLQCDSSSRIMRSDTVYDLITGCYRKSSATYQDDAKKMLMGGSAITSYNNKSYKIDDIDFGACPENAFTNERGVSQTYIDYYKNQYGVIIKEAKQPMLMSSVKRSAPHPPLQVMLVPELCFLAGMTDAHRMDFKVMKDVAEFTRLPPARKQKIVSGLLNSILENKEAVQHLDNWGLSLSDKNLNVEGRVISAPTLHFGGGYKETVGPKCDWGRASTSKSVLSAVNLDKWVLMFPEKEDRVARSFCDTLIQQATKMGIRINMPRVEKLQQDKVEAYLTAIRKSDDDTQMVVSLFSGLPRADRYAAVKKLCYIELGRPNQVVMLKTLGNERRMVAIVQKIALQINCKLGGELWGCKIPLPNLMVIGIDVYRDKSSSKGNIAAIVASMNGSFSKYFSKVVFESAAAGGNFVASLTEGLKEAVKMFRQVNAVGPAKIIIFRDGVNAGQLFAAQREAVMMAEGIKGLFAGADVPQVSVVIVQKKITIRFYQAVHGGNVDNPPAGTIVDHTVTLRNYYDFYLIPMLVNQGTVTPVHFVVVHDDSDFKPEVMQRLAFAMTHCYFNWPGNVRVPAPCQYAHKLVEMVGEHLHQEPNKKLQDRLFFL